MTLNNILGHVTTFHPPHPHSFPLQWPQESLTKATWDSTASVSFTKAVRSVALEFSSLPKTKLLCPQQNKERSEKETTDP